MTKRNHIILCWIGRQMLLTCRVLIGTTFVPSGLALFSTILPSTSILGNPAAFKALAVTACLCMVGATLASWAVEPLRAMVRRHTPPQ